MKHVAPVRRELGIRTVFNLLGPLANPAGARLQLLGVFAPRWCQTFAEVLKQLGSESAMVVCGTGPGGTGLLDELSTFGTTTVARLKEGRVALEEVRPEDAGLGLARSAEGLTAAGPEESAAIIRQILEGKKGPARDIVVLNAAAAALIAGKAKDWPGARELAEWSIDEGKAKWALSVLMVASHGALP
jgi:anthranilate phosphoribosyltransferase